MKVAIFGGTGFVGIRSWLPEHRSKLQKNVLVVFFHTHNRNVLECSGNSSNGFAIGPITPNF